MIWNYMATNRTENIEETIVLETKARINLWSSHNNFSNLANFIIQ